MKINFKRLDVLRKRHEGLQTRLDKLFKLKGTRAALQVKVMINGQLIEMWSVERTKEYINTAISQTTQEIDVVETELICEMSKQATRYGD